MGMSASQARLLTLTARLSDLELRAQMISNSKIRLSMESETAAETYADALDQTKLSLLTGYSTTGAAQYTDLTYDNLTSYDAASNLLTQYCLSDNNGNMLVTQDMANKFEKSDSLEDFLKANGVGETYIYPNGVTEAKFKAAQDAVSSTYAAYNTAKAATATALKNLDTYGSTNVVGYTSGGNWKYTTTVVTPATQTNIDHVGFGFWYDPSLYTTDANGAVSGKDSEKLADNSTYKLFTGDDIQIYGTYTTSKATSDTVTMKVGNQTVTLKSDGTATIDGKTLSNSTTTTLADKSTITYHKGVATGDKNSYITLNSGDGSGSVTIWSDAANAGAMLVAPTGKFSGLGGLVGDAYKNGKVTSGTDWSKYLVCTSANATSTANAINTNAKGYTPPPATTTTTTYSSQNTGDPIAFKTSAGNATAYNALKTTYTSAVNNETKASTALTAAKKALNDLGVTTGYTDPKKTTYYANIYNKMCEGYVTMDNEANTLDSAAWIQAQIKSGNLVLEKCVNSSTTSSTSTTSSALNTGTWENTEWGSDSNIHSGTDDDAAAKAEAVYDAEMAKIETKDKKFDLELKNIDTEHNAVQTEIDSVEKVIQKNIERTFKMFQA